jgi:NADH-quinone oxidoreductase subunit L
MGFVLHAFAGPVVYLALAGVGVAYWIYMVKPQFAADMQQRFAVIHKVMENKYYMDYLYMNVFSGIGRATGQLLWKIGDTLLIDGLVVNGSARVVGWFSSIVRHLQTGYLYHYAFAMIAGIMVLVSVFVMKGIF